LRDYLREYTVDVSSPGTARPLRKPRHFASVVGRKVSLRTAQPVAGRSKFKGEVTDVHDDTLSVTVDGADVDIPYEAIVRGNLIDERVGDEPGDHRSCSRDRARQGHRGGRARHR